MKTGKWKRVLPLLALMAGPLRAQDAPFVNINPAFSPDGKTIVFESRIYGQAEIFVVDVGGGEPIRLTDNRADDTQTSFSPDGSSILFDSYRDGFWSLYLMDEDGMGQRRITHRDTFSTVHVGRHPAWSPDGTVNSLPSWSPDDRVITYSATRTGVAEVYTVEVETGATARLTTGTEEYR